MSNTFPKRLEPRPELDQLAKEVAESLGCKEQLTRSFIRVAFEAVKVFDHKQGKYGPGNIAEFGETGVMIRATDKLKRLAHLWRTNQDPQDETKEDTWGDLANYGLIALMCRLGKWPDVSQARMQAEIDIDLSEQTAGTR